MPAAASETECPQPLRRADTRRASGFPDTLALVRAATSRRHIALERLPRLARLASGQANRDDYVTTLGRLAAAYAALDQTIHTLDAYRPAPLPPYRPRAPRLVTEARDLGIALPAAYAPELPAHDRTGGYLGMRYVLDGAQFGHRATAAAIANSNLAGFLARRDSFWATEFVSRQDWQCLCQSLARLADRRQAAAAAVFGRHVFAHFQRQLSAG